MEAAGHLDIQAEKLDLVMRDEDFAIYHQDKPLLTPAGNEIAHSDARLLRYMMTELSLDSKAPAYGTHAYGLFSWLTDFKEQEITTRIEKEMPADILLRHRTKNTAGSLINLPGILDYIEENPSLINMFFWAISMVAEGLREFTEKARQGETEKTDDPEFLSTRIGEIFAAMKPEKKAAVSLLSESHDNGFMLPLLLVLGHITPREYATVTMAGYSGIHRPDDPAKSGLEEIWKNPEQHIRKLHREASCLVEFLSYFGESRNAISVIKELIARGENDALEFKSTFRWDIRQNKKNPAIEHAALKTMAAFMNSEGGDLLIGVEDDGNILGVETDGFPNDDKFLLHVWSVIKSSMGQEVSPYLKTTLEKFDGKTVCRVHCLKSPKPVFLRQKGFDEAFYIRSGPGTSSLDISEALRYIGERF